MYVVYNPDVSTDRAVTLAYDLDSTDIVQQLAYDLGSTDIVQHFALYSRNTIAEAF